MRDVYFSNKPSLNDDALRLQTLVTQTETLHISVMLLFFPLSGYFLHISCHMCIFCVHTTVRSDNTLGWLTVGRDSRRATEQWEASSSIHTNRSSD